MISVNQAQQLVATNTPLAISVETHLLGARGMVLRREIRAERDAPPFDRSTMDGIAIRYSDKLSFPIDGLSRAGAPVDLVENSDSCFEIMTGAIVPKEFDTVIPYEKVTIEDKVATIESDLNPTVGQFISSKGDHHRKGDLILKGGVRLTVPQIGIIASEGVSEVSVSKLPSIAIVNTGDELIDLGNDLEDYQIRSSNKYALTALFEQYGIVDINNFHIADDENKTVSELEKIIESHDICVLSGGVSKGKFDYVPGALEKLGVEKIFHRVAQKPGRPLWFGKRDNKLVFGLPGNPISSLVCARRYVIPAIDKMLSYKTKELNASLTSDVIFRSDLSYFIPVKISSSSSGVLEATPISFKGSGDYSALAQSDGILELPAHKDEFKKGESYPLYLWNQMERNS